MDRLILSIRVKDTDVWSAFYNQCLRHLLLENGAYDIKVFNTESSPRLYTYAILTSGSRLENFVQSGMMCRVLRKYGFTDRFSVMRAYN